MDKTEGITVQRFREDWYCVSDRKRGGVYFDGGELRAIVEQGAALLGLRVVPALRAVPDGAP